MHFLEFFLTMSKSSIYVFRLTTTGQDHHQQHTTSVTLKQYTIIVWNRSILLMWWKVFDLNSKYTVLWNECVTYTHREHGYESAPWTEKYILTL